TEDWYLFPSVCSEEINCSVRRTGRPPSSTRPWRPRPQSTAIGPGGHGTGGVADATGQVHRSLIDCALLADELRAGLPAEEIDPARVRTSSTSGQPRRPNLHAGPDHLRLHSPLGRS